MARLILIHGAWGNAGGWARVTPLLHRAGHRAEAIDLPGHGRSPRAPETVGMEDYVHHVAALLDEGPAWLVAHSLGGMVAAEVAARRPDSVRGCIFVAALLPRPGDSLLSLIRTQDGRGMADHVRPGPAPGTTVLAPDAAGILVQDASPRDQAALLAGSSVQSNRAQTDPVSLGPGFGRVPKAYVLCRQDRVVTPPLQRRMVAATPVEALFELDCGHVPQLTQPQALARIVDGIVRA